MLTWLRVGSRGLLEAEEAGRKGRAWIGFRAEVLELIGQCVGRSLFSFVYLLFCSRRRYADASRDVGPGARLALKHSTTGWLLGPWRDLGRNVPVASPLLPPRRLHRSWFQVLMQWLLKIVALDGKPQMLSFESEKELISADIC